MAEILLTWSLCLGQSIIKFVTECLSIQICFIIEAHIYVCDPFPLRNGGIHHEHSVFGLKELYSNY